MSDSSSSSFDDPDLNAAREEYLARIRDDHSGTSPNEDSSLVESSADTDDHSGTSPNEADTVPFLRPSLVEFSENIGFFSLGILSLFLWAFGFEGKVEKPQDVTEISFHEGEFLVTTKNHLVCRHFIPARTGLWLRLLCYPIIVAILVGLGSVMMIILVSAWSMASTIFFAWHHPILSLVVAGPGILVIVYKIYQLFTRKC